MPYLNLSLQLFDTVCMCVPFLKAVLRKLCSWYINFWSKVKIPPFGNLYIYLFIYLLSFGFCTDTTQSLPDAIEAKSVYVSFFLIWLLVLCCRELIEDDEPFSLFWFISFSLNFNSCAFLSNSWILFCNSLADWASNSSS